MPDSTSPNLDTENREPQITREPSNQSGGVNVEAINVTVGQDVVGRDKVIHLNIDKYYAAPNANTSEPQEKLIEEKQGRSPILDMLLWLLWVLGATLLAALAVIVGGWLWNFINILLGWTFYLGGSGNEPYGFAAFVWGAILAFVVSVFAFMAGVWYLPRKRRSLRQILVTIALYTIFGGLGAMLFYDSGVRHWVESKNLGYAGQELIIAAMWSLGLSVSTCLPLLVLPQSVNVLDQRRVWLQIPLSVVLVALAVFVSFNIALPAMRIDQLRGFFAGVALRLGLYLGLLISIVQELRLRLLLYSLWSNVLRPLITQSHIPGGPEQK